MVYKLANISEMINLNKDAIYDFSLSGYDETTFFRRVWLNISSKKYINLSYR